MYSTKWEFDGFGVIPRGTPIGKRTHGVSWLSDMDDTWSDMARKAAAPLCGFLYMGLSLGTGSCLWDARLAMCRFANGFLPGYEHRALSHGPPCVRFPMGVPLGMSPEPSNSHLVLYENFRSFKMLGMGSSMIRPVRQHQDDFEQSS